MVLLLSAFVSNFVFSDKEISDLSEKIYPIWDESCGKDFIDYTSERVGFRNGIKYTKESILTVLNKIKSE